MGAGAGAGVAVGGGGVAGVSTGAGLGEGAADLDSAAASSGFAYTTILPESSELVTYPSCPHPANTTQASPKAIPCNRRNPCSLISTALLRDAPP